MNTRNHLQEIEISTVLVATMAVPGSNFWSICKNRNVNQSSGGGIKLMNAYLVRAVESAVLEQQYLQTQTSSI